MKKTSRVHFDTELSTNLMDLKNFQDPHTPPEQVMLRLTPTEQLNFPYGGEESECHLEILSSRRITYKIQTSAPEKFRVRPRCGILNPGESVSISLVLKSGHKLAEANKDKFLVMCIELNTGYQISMPHIVELWKNKSSNDDNIEKHRLFCQYMPRASETAAGAALTSTPLVTAAASGTAQPGVSFAEDRSYLDLVMARQQKHFDSHLSKQNMWIKLTLFFVLTIGFGVAFLIYQSINIIEPMPIIP